MSRIQPSLPGASHGSLGFMIFCAKSNAYVVFAIAASHCALWTQLLRGQDRAPAPRHAMHFSLEFRSNSLIQRVLLLIGSIAASELWRCTAH